MLRQRKPLRAAGLIRKDKSECPFKRFILSSRTKLEDVPNAKQRRPMALVEPPECRFANYLAHFFANYLAHPNA
jgi:hypothetical protein